MGALALAAAFAVGMWALPGDVDARVDQIAAGFPGDAICYIGGIVSALASTTGILGALIPLVVPGWL